MFNAISAFFEQENPPHMLSESNKNRITWNFAIVHTSDERTFALIETMQCNLVAHDWLRTKIIWHAIVKIESFLFSLSRHSSPLTFRHWHLANMEKLKRLARWHSHVAMCQGVHGHTLALRLLHGFVCVCACVCFKKCNQMIRWWIASKSNEKQLVRLNSTFFFFFS